MSRFLLAACLLLSVLAAVQAQPNVLLQTFDSVDCSGSVVRSSSAVRNINVCNDNSADDLTPSSDQSFISPDGMYQYDVTYQTSDCRAGSHVTVEATMLNGCQADVARGKSRRMSAFNVTQAQPMPFTFPPEGWSTTVNCENVTSSGPVLAPITCSPTPMGQIQQVACSTLARKMGNCRPVRGAVGQWEADLCAGGSEYVGGRVLYSDAACQNVINAELLPTGCNFGSRSFCAGTAFLPATLPVGGWTEYPNVNCTADPLRGRYHTMLKSSACEASGGRGFTYVCNGTTNFLVNAFLAEDCSGVPYNTRVKSLSQCEANGDDGNSYFCGFVVPPNPLNAAAAVSVSSVSVLIAAVLALLASRSL